MPMLSVELTPEADRLLRRKLASGEYADESEALSEALLIFDDLSHYLYEARRERLRSRLAEGIAQAERGEFVNVTAEDIMRKTKERMEAKHA